jgi:cytochrome c2
MRHSLVFVAGMLAAGAAAMPVSLLIQHAQSERQAKTVAAQLTRGDPERGRADVLQRRCGACHKIPGLPGADGEVGPSLDGLPRRAVIAGRLPNQPEAMVAWLRSPHAIVPDVGMPELGLGEPEARDIAAYLYTLRGR